MATASTASIDNPRKRPRAARACDLCRAKKYKCDELYPCAHCKKQKVNCVYQRAGSIHARQRSPSYVVELERRVEELSSRLQVMAAEKPAEVGSISLLDDPSTHTASTRFDIDAKYPQRVQHDGKVQDIHNTAATVRKARSILPCGEDGEPPSDGESNPETGGEVRDVNDHTKSIEFHGNTSSMAFLSLLQSQSQAHPQPSPWGQGSLSQKASLVSTLHNVAFSPDSHDLPAARDLLSQNESFYFRHSRVFLDGYFENLHFIHPILHREEFFARCEDLWFGRFEKQSRSFIALYYSVMSLGAIIRVWDEKVLDGMDRFQWSRKLFHQARLALGEVSATNDLETVQCFIFMAKVCQNELNPHLAYIYLGMAVRASLSAGHHREPVSKSTSLNHSETQSSISKTWWGLYPLEVEISFSLGRPDSLGSDEYYNRQIPPMDDSEFDILPVMIPFARITRKVSTAIYLSRTSIRDKISIADQIETEMDMWLNTLPEVIRPEINTTVDGLRILKDPKWARRQKLVLQLRYCNVKMVLYRPFILYTSRNPLRLPLILKATINKCVAAAKMTIEVVYDTFCHHTFFRSWWYNITYILYAASIILCYATQAAPLDEKQALFRLVDITILILDAMDECVVAGKAGEMIKQTLLNAREHVSVGQSTSPQLQSPSQDSKLKVRTSEDFSINAMLDSQMPSLNMEAIFDFDEATMAMDETQFLFWTDLQGPVGGVGP